MQPPGYQPPSPLNQSIQQFRRPTYNPAPSPLEINPGLLALLHQVMAQRVSENPGGPTVPSSPTPPPASYAHSGGLQPIDDTVMGELGNSGGPSQNQTKLLQMLLTHFGSSLQTRPERPVGGGIPASARGNIAPRAELFRQAYI
jgi:hypothetical protein